MLLTLAAQYFEPSAERFVYAALRPVFQKTGFHISFWAARALVIFLFNI
jgi:hypothetical protein